jgi:hypothetical protein
VPGPTSRIKALLLLQKVWIWCQKVWKGWSQQPPCLPKEVFDQLRHLPDPVADSEHYKSFEYVYGCMTTEKDCPSLKSSSKKSHVIPFSPSAQTARILRLCSECLKPHVVYSRQKLKIHEEYALECMYPIHPWEYLKRARSK